MMDRVKAKWDDLTEGDKVALILKAHIKNGFFCHGNSQQVSLGTQVPEEYWQPDGWECITLRICI